MARRITINDSGVTQIVKMLEKSNDKEELIADTLIGFNPVLQSPIIYDVIDNAQLFMAGVAEALTKSEDALENIYDELVKGSIFQRLDDVFDAFTGNKMQEEENRREMIDAIESLVSGSGKGGGMAPIAVVDTPEGPSPIKQGIFAGISQFIAEKVSAIIPRQFKAVFSSLGSVFAGVLKFGKLLVKFAGPIAIAVAVITGIIGAIKGGIEGYKNGGVEGAIKGALIGAIDMLIGSLVKGLADAAGWLLSALGFTELGSLLGPSIKKMFDNFFSGIEGIVDIFAGIFTLDADKVVGGIKKIVTAGIANIKLISKMMWTLIKELIPLTWKVLKGVLWDIPKLLGELIARGVDWLWNDFPGVFGNAMKSLSEFIGQLWAKAKSDLFPWLGQQVVSLLDSLSVALTNMLGTAFLWLDQLLSWSTITDTIGSAADIINRVSDSVIDFVNGIVDGIVSFFSEAPAAIADMMKSASDMATEFAKKVLKSILPDASKHKSMSDPLHWVGKAIPDNVYAFAGVRTPEQIENDLNQGGANPYIKKGQELQAKEAKFASDVLMVQDYLKSIPSNAGATLSQSSTTQPAAPVIINNMGGNVTNNSSSNVNNNTSPFEPILTGSSMGFSAF